MGEGVLVYIRTSRRRRLSFLFLVMVTVVVIVGDGAIDL